MIHFSIYTNGSTDELDTDKLQKAANQKLYLKERKVHIYMFPTDEFFRLIDQNKKQKMI